MFRDRLTPMESALMFGVVAGLLMHGTGWLAGAYGGIVAALFHNFDFVVPFEKLQFSNSQDWIQVGLIVATVALMSVLGSRRRRLVATKRTLRPSTSPKRAQPQWGAELEGSRH